MPRQPDAPIQFAGTVSPGAQQSVQRGKEALLGAMKASEQQAGATQRTAMGVQAQRQSQEAQQAFQAEQSDKDREARIVGAEADRRHQEKLLEIQGRLTSDRIKLEQDYAREGREWDKARADEQEKRLMALWKAEKRWDAHMAQERGKAALQVARINAKQRSDMAKLGIVHLKQAEERQQKREMHSQLTENIQARAAESYKQMTDKQGFMARYVAGEEDFDSILNAELKNQAVQSVMGRDLTSANKSILETKISSGQVTGDDFVKIQAVLEASAEALGKEQKAAESDDDTELQRYYGAAKKDVLGKLLLWKNLRDSKLSMTQGSNLTVGQFISEKIRDYEGTNFSAITEDLVGKVGNDTDAIINELSNIYEYERLAIPEDMTDKYERGLLEFMNSTLGR